jgi:hypothetical protein
MKVRILFTAIVLALAGCASAPLGVQNYTGFTELKFPSNSLAPGQIIEVYSKPEKIEITHQPDIPWDRVSTSPGWDMAGADVSEVKANLTLEVLKVLEATGQATANTRAVVQLTNTKTALIPKEVIYSALKKNISSNESLKEQINDYSDNGTRFDVITSTLTATVAFSLVDANNNELKIDSEVIQKLNSKLNLGLTLANGNATAISGKDLVVGIHYDPNMIRLILKKI